MTAVQLHRYTRAQSPRRFGHTVHMPDTITNRTVYDMQPVVIVLSLFGFLPAARLCWRRGK